MSFGSSLFRHLLAAREGQRLEPSMFDGGETVWLTRMEALPMKVAHSGSVALPGVSANSAPTGTLTEDRNLHRFGSIELDSRVPFCQRRWA
jgi:hypothetical protein